jgi:hypothetical protein
MSCGCDIKIINEENKIIVTEENNVIVVSHADGRDGKSAYQQAVEGGYTGTEQEFNCSLSLLADVAEGKQSLVDAIEYKGGTSNADKSLQGIAGDIKKIPNFDQWARLAGILAGEPAYDTLSGHIQNEKAGNIKVFDDRFGVVTSIRAGTFCYWDILEEIRVPSLMILRVQPIAYMSNLKRFIAPQLAEYGNLYYDPLRGTDLTYVEVGSLTYVYSSFFVETPQMNLRNVTIGQDTDINLPFQYWYATNVVAEGQSGIDELNENLYNNLLTKLYDHSEDGETRTLRLGWLAHVTQENIDYANAKGWTLTK